MTTGPLSIISPFSLSLRSLWSYCILVTGLDRPLPCPHISPGSPRCNSCLVQADRKCANFLFLVMASDWRTMDARYPHPERNTYTQVENCFRDPCHNAQYYLSSSRKVPCHARTHHAPHHTSSAAQTSQDDR